MTKAERYASYAQKVKNPPTFQFPNLFMRAEVGLSGGVEFNVWPHIPAKNVPAFIDWLHDTFVRQIGDSPHWYWDK